MKVLHVITSVGTGGAELALCRLLEFQSGSGIVHAVAALASDGPRGAEASRVRATGVDFIDIRMPSAWPDPRAFYRLREAISAHRPNIIHGWMYHANIAIAVAGGRTPLIWGVRHSLYGFEHERLRTRFIIRLGAVLSERPAAIVYNAATSAKQHEEIGYCKERTIVIPNGIDSSHFRPSAEERARVRAEFGIRDGQLVIGHIARWHPVKDHKNLLQAAARFIRGNPNTVFMLVGEGLDLRNGELAEITRKLALDDCLKLCGRRSDISSILPAMDIVTSSSRSEAFPNAIAEAMACGVPCVATDVGDIHEIIGDTGAVVPPGNPVALSEGWLRIARLDPEARRLLGQSARDRIVKFYSAAACSSRYDALYSQVGN